MARPKKPPLLQTLRVLLDEAAAERDTDVPPGLKIVDLTADPLEVVVAGTGEVYTRIPKGVARGRRCPHNRAVELTWRSHNT